MRIVKSLLVVLIVAQFCVGCVSSKEFNGAISDLGDNIVLTGSIEIIPPLKEGEQDVRDYLGGKSLENKILFALGNRIYTKDDINISNLGNLVQVEIGKPFYVKQKYYNKLYLSLVFLFMGVNEYMYFPGNFLIEAPVGCKVIYLGKIRYYRDIYNAITKIEIVDEFDTAKQDAEKKYNQQVDMCRVKLNLVKE
jgi:hypothetical protein